MNIQPNNFTEVDPSLKEKYRIRSLKGAATRRRKGEQELLRRQQLINFEDSSLESDVQPMQILIVRLNICNKPI